MNKTQNIAVNKLHPNNGQLEHLGLPKNPRFIRDEKFNKLKKSLESHPMFLEDRPIIAYDNGGEFVVLCGNMRLRAAKDLGWKEIPCIIKQKDSDIEELKALSAIDNSNFGEWDWDLLANEWDISDLEDWGIDVPHVEEPEEPDDNSDSYSSSFKLEITIDSEKEQENLYNELSARGFDVKILHI